MKETFTSEVVIVNFHGSVILPYCSRAKKMYEHNALGYWSGLALCLTKVRSSRARCPATALIIKRQKWAMVMKWHNWKEITTQTGKD